MFVDVEWTKELTHLIIEICVVIFLVLSSLYKWVPLDEGKNCLFVIVDASCGLGSTNLHGNPLPDRDAERGLSSDHWVQP